MVEVTHFTIRSNPDGPSTLYAVKENKERFWVCTSNDISGISLGVMCRLLNEGLEYRRARSQLVNEFLGVRGE